MGKQRRPRGPRSTWEPKPASDENPGIATASPPDVALPAAEPAEAATDAPMPADARTDETPSPSASAFQAEVEPIAAATESPPDSADALPAMKPEETVAASESPPEAVEAPPAAEPEAVVADEPAHAHAEEPIAAAPAVDVEPEPEPEPAFAFAAPTVVFDESGPVAPMAPSAPVRPTVAGFPISFAPERLDLTGIGATISGYMRGESEAAAAYMRALGGARSPADMIRLQVGEFQRAADASLTCWSIVAHKASRAFAYR